MPGLHPQPTRAVKGSSPPRRPRPGGSARARGLRSRRMAARESRRGQVLLEFAFVSLAFYFLLAGTLELGRALHASQALQNATRVLGRELSVTPMPATISFDVALGLSPPTTLAELEAAERVRETVFDAGLLALDVSGLSGSAYDDRLATLPVVNRMLVPLMIRESIAIGGGPELDVLRYPGALFSNPNFDPLDARPGELGYLVRIPRVLARDDDGHETIEWVDVVSEVRHSSGDGPFSILSTAPLRGTVAVRMLYPFQAATLSAYRTDAEGQNDPVLADDGAVTVAGAEGAPVGFESSTVPGYSGTYGLGSQQALTRTVRPFRRLLSAQSISRREVFQ